MDLKVIPKSYKGHKFILSIIDEVMNYLITVPIYQTRSEETYNALIHIVISKYCVSDFIIMDHDTASMSSLMLSLVSNGVSYTSLDGQLRNLYIITIIKGQLSKVKFKGQIY